MTVKVTVKADGLVSVLNELKAPAVLNQVGDLAIEEIKTSLEVGLSPVRGERRFVAYKDPMKYPGNKKPARPVNLILTGAMLDALRYSIKGLRLFIGISGTQAVKAEAHNEGTGKMPERHFLPTRQGEEFTVSITEKIKDLYAKILSDIIDRNRR